MQYDELELYSTYLRPYNTTSIHTNFSHRYYNSKCAMSILFIVTSAYGTRKTICFYFCIRFFSFVCLNTTIAMNVLNGTFQQSWKQMILHSFGFFFRLFFQLSTDSIEIDSKILIFFFNNLFSSILLFNVDRFLLQKRK